MYKHKERSRNLLLEQMLFFSSFNEMNGDQFCVDMKDVWIVLTARLSCCIVRFLGNNPQELCLNIILSHLIQD